MNVVSIVVSSGFLLGPVKVQIRRHGWSQRAVLKLRASGGRTSQQQALGQIRSIARSRCCVSGPPHWTHEMVIFWTFT
jgi:hypothetical protein